MKKVHYLITIYFSKYFSIAKFAYSVVYIFVKIINGITLKYVLYVKRSDSPVQLKYKSFLKNEKV